MKNVLNYESIIITVGSRDEMFFGEKMKNGK